MVYIYRFIMIWEIFQTWRIWVRTPILLLDPCSIPHLRCKSLNSREFKYSVFFCRIHFWDNHGTSFFIDFIRFSRWKIGFKIRFSIRNLEPFFLKIMENLWNLMENVGTQNGKPMENLWKNRWTFPKISIVRLCQTIHLPSPSSSGSVCSFVAVPWGKCLHHWNVTWTYDICSDICFKVFCFFFSFSFLMIRLFAYCLHIWYTDFGSRYLFSATNMDAPKGPLRARARITDQKNGWSTMIRKSFTLWLCQNSYWKWP